jgi:Ca2+-transporting ATPase
MSHKQPPWHALDIDEVFQTLESSPEGLTSVEAGERLRTYGYNVVVEEKRTHPLIIFLNQFKNPLVLLLIFASILSFSIGEAFDSIIIIVLVILSAIIGFYQEYRAERALEAIKKMASPRALVLRDGKPVMIDASEVVPGDVLILQSGDKVAADARIFEAVSLRMDESPLTGESTPVEKSTEKLPEDTEVADRVNMAFAGTVVVYGKGKAVVVATGKNTVLGKIASAIESAEEKTTPLEKELSGLSRWLLVLMIGVAFVVSLTGFFIRGYSVLDIIIWTISLAVAAVPEALPVVVTSSLAIGVYKMAKRNAIVRRLPAVETLGSTTYICSDKTGTMTKGEMTVTKIWIRDTTIDVTGTGYAPKGEFRINTQVIDPKQYVGLRLLLLAGLNNNDSELQEVNGEWIGQGDGTEIALKTLAYKAGVKEVLPRLSEVPFSSERKRMSTLHILNGKKILFVKGAPDIIVALSTQIATINGEVQPLTEETKREILKANDELASQGLRNLALAYRYLEGDEEEIGEDAEKNLVFLGIVSMIDPPRPEVKEALETCKQAGINVAMITGDHLLTAVAVARQLGMMSKEDIAITGRDLEKMSDEELYSKVEKIRVYARVSPEHKLRIVNALKKRGHIVAMTGDGVNDAPALKAADIGVAMGKTGTEVAKEASDLILADDNFATIVEAIKLGREIFENIKKFIVYLLSANFAELLLPLSTAVLGLPLPFTATQILWVNLVTDGPPALALSLEKGEKDLIFRSPRKPGEPLFSKKEIIVYFVVVPVLLTLLLTGSFHILLARGEPEIEARTTVFTSLIITELVMAYALRSLHKPSLKLNPLDNKWLALILILSLLLQLAVLSIPQLANLLGISPITAYDLAHAAIVAVTMFISVEIAKKFLNH